MVRTWAVAAGVLVGSFAAPGLASAAPPDPGLLARLAQSEQAIEATAKHANYRAEEVVEQLDGDGKVASTRTAHYRIESTGGVRNQIVESAVEDGKDVTAEEQDKVKKEQQERQSKKKDRPVWPFSPGADATYTYDQVAVNPQHPDYVEIAFTPKHPDGKSFEGKVWVDSPSGRFLSASVRLSKPPMLVDWVHLTAEFDATPAGPALSHLTFEGSGGLLFIRKHFRGHLKTSDWQPSP